MISCVTPINPLNNILKNHFQIRWQQISNKRLSERVCSSLGTSATNQKERTFNLEIHNKTENQIPSRSNYIQ